MKLDKDILKWLFSQELSQDSCRCYDEGGVLYLFLGGDLSLRFDCSKRRECKSSSIIPIEKIDLDELVNSHELHGVQLVGAVDYHEKDELTVADTISITRQKLFMLRYLEKNSIPYNHYVVKNRECDDSLLLRGTDSLMEFGYYIDLDECVWQNRDMLQLLLNVLPSGGSDIYSAYLQEDILLNRGVSLPIIGTSTKVRRLGYLKNFVTLFHGTQRMPKVGFEKRLREKLCIYNEELQNHKNTKGIIQKTQFNASVRPYLDLATSLGILIPNTMGVELGKFGMLYQKLLDENNAGMNLSMLDKSIFLETILKNDYFYTYIILEYAFVSKSVNYHNLRNIFKQRIIDYLDGILQDDCVVDGKELNLVRMLRKRVLEWSKPEVYLEHILMPRLNWLYDLDLIELHNDLSFSLTSAGERLLFHLVAWMGVCMGSSIAISRMLEKYYMRMFDNVYDINLSGYLPIANDILSQLLNDSLKLFRTLASNRVTYSIFVGYAKRRLMFDYKMCVDENEIKEYFLLAHPEQYVFNYQEYYQDGYIQLKLK